VSGPRRQGKPGTLDGFVRRFAREKRISIVEARTILDAVLEAVLADVRETGRLALPGFGTFRRAKRKARRVRAPNGEWHHVPAREEVRFRGWRGRYRPAVPKRLASTSRSTGFVSSRVST